MECIGGGRTGTNEIQTTCCTCKKILPGPVLTAFTRERIQPYYHRNNKPEAIDRDKKCTHVTPSLRRSTDNQGFIGDAHSQLIRTHMPALGSCSSGRDRQPMSFGTPASAGRAICLPPPRERQG